MQQEGAYLAVVGGQSQCLLERIVGVGESAQPPRRGPDVVQDQRHALGAGAAAHRCTRRASSSTSAQRPSAQRTVIRHWLSQYLQVSSVRAAGRFRPLERLPRVERQISSTDPDGQQRHPLRAGRAAVRQRGAPVVEIGQRGRSGITRSVSRPSCSPPPAAIHASASRIQWSTWARRAHAPTRPASGLERLRRRYARIVSSMS